MRLTLIRHKANDFATYGRIFAQDGHELCVTIERPWVDRNADGKRDANVSRIRAGTYRAVRRKSPKRGYEVWWLIGVPDVTLAPFEHEVPDATTCQIHRANLPDELEGCIGVGAAFGPVKRDRDPVELPGITGSKNAFEKFMRETANEDEIEIEVVDPK